MNLVFTKKSILTLLIICLFPVINGYAGSEKSRKDIVYQMYRDYQKNFSDVNEINVKDVINNLNDEQILFVDVRTEKEMSVSMLPKAISKEDFLSNQNLYHNKKIVVYCTIGYRSGLFAAEMKKSGITVYNLSAGALGWIHEDGKVYDSRGIVKRLHVYGKNWDYAPAEFETITFGFFEKLLN